jgi:DNA-directed RNA polymerase subunit RPC12/RpoP
MTDLSATAGGVRAASLRDPDEVAQVIGKAFARSPAVFHRWDFVKDNKVHRPGAAAALSFWAGLLLIAVSIYVFYLVILAITSFLDDLTGKEFSKYNQEIGIYVAASIFARYLFSLGKWLTTARFGTWSGQCPHCESDLHIPSKDTAATCPTCLHRVMLRDGQFVDV